MVLHQEGQARSRQALFHLCRQCQATQEPSPPDRGLQTGKPQYQTGSHHRGKEGRLYQWREFHFRADQGT